MTRPMLLPALLACLMVAQLAAATRDTMTSPGRALQAVPITLTRQQFVQATWALQGVTCAGVYATAKDKNFNNTLAKAVTKDFADALTSAGWPSAAKTVVAVRQPCRDVTFKDKTYASLRVGVRFNSTTDTQVRDDMWAAVGSPKVTKLCTGGYNTTLYKNVAALFAKHKFKVSQNNGTRTNMFYPGGTMWVEYAAPCVPKPKPSPSPSPPPQPSPSLSPAPILKAPVINVPVGTTSCNKSDVQALADGLKAQVTNGMDAAEASLVYVEVADCKPVGKARRHLLANSVVTLAITISPLVQSPAQIEAATRAVYQAVTGNPAESLPAGASLDTVLAIMNKDLASGDAQQLVQKVQQAIAQQNLTAVFDVTVTNTTAITGGAEATKCPSLPPAITSATWGGQCLNQEHGFVCTGTCSTGGTVSATCTTDGTYALAAGAACPATQQPTKTCTGVPSTTPEGAAWPSGGCTNQTQCTAACSGDTTGTVSSVCDNLKGAWSEPSGTCTPIRCVGVPQTNVANANWLTNCPITIGSTCTAKCIGEGTDTKATCNKVGTSDTADWGITVTGSCSAAYGPGATCADTNGATAGQPNIVCGDGLSAKDGASSTPIAGMAEDAAIKACCSALYGATATCASDWKGACASGTTLNPSGAINGLAKDSAEARAVCCVAPASPSPGPVVSSPSQKPANPSPTPGNPSPSPQTQASPSPAPCTPTCMDITTGVIGASCASKGNGCGGTCTTTCSAAGQTLVCENSACKCITTCSSTSNLVAGVACGDISDGCGSTCARDCAAGLTCNAGACCKPTCTGDVVVGRNQTCGDTLSNSCGGTCPRVCNTTVDVCTDNSCKCKATCTSATNVPVDGNCGLIDDGCERTCNITCNAGLTCTANKKCCSPSCSASGGNTTVSTGAPCGPKSDGCGGKCTNQFNLCNNTDICKDGICKIDCNATCNSTTDVALYDSCAQQDDGCGGICNHTCATGLKCGPQITCCSPSCPGNYTVGIGNYCGPRYDTCGGFCTDAYYVCNSTEDCDGGRCVVIGPCNATCNSTTDLALGNSCAPEPNGPSCPGGNRTVSKGSYCGPANKYCGGPCTDVFDVCSAPNVCEYELCVCKASCTSTTGVAGGNSCVEEVNVCGGNCTHACSGELTCSTLTGLCCSLDCTGNSTTAATGEPCGAKDDSCGGKCADSFINCSGDNDECINNVCKCQACTDDPNIQSGGTCGVMIACGVTCTKSCASGSGLLCSINGVCEVVQ
ncbi:hypothetical protein OEZ86_012254 [Tetradesmus obliquus]|nr:hypothetical protein OEZ86_012254 [Tetradesmus obliquus]